MNSVQKIYNAALVGNVENVTHLAETDGADEMQGKKVVVLKTDGNAVDPVRKQLITALKNEYGHDNAYVNELKAKLMADNESSELAQKPLSKRDIQQSIIYVRASEQNVRRVLDDTLLFARFPQCAIDHLQRVLAGNARHPDVIKFLDNTPKTPLEKYDQLCRVCALAASLSEENELYSTAYLKGFSDHAMFASYDAVDHRTDIVPRNGPNAPVQGGGTLIRMQDVNGFGNLLGGNPSRKVLTGLNGAVHGLLEGVCAKNNLGVADLSADQVKNALRFVSDVLKKQLEGVGCKFPQDDGNDTDQEVKNFLGPLQDALEEALKQATFDKVFNLVAQ